jgi:hypothetical protein
MAPTDEVGQRNGMVWVEGKGYVRIAKAHAYAALGLTVRWDTAEPEDNVNTGLAYKND